MPQVPPGTPFEDLFEEFFNRRGGKGGERGDNDAPRQQRKSNSLGSGFIIDASGIVVTNNHVIGDANDIHPTRKQPVGARLALAARALAQSVHADHVHRAAQGKCAHHTLAEQRVIVHDRDLELFSHPTLRWSRRATPRRR